MPQDYKILQHGYDDPVSPERWCLVLDFFISKSAEQTNKQTEKPKLKNDPGKLRALEKTHTHTKGREVVQKINRCLGEGKKP